MPREPGRRRQGELRPRRRRVRRRARRRRACGSAPDPSPCEQLPGLLEVGADVGRHEPHLVGAALGQARQQLQLLVGQHGLVDAGALDRLDDARDRERLALGPQHPGLLLALGGEHRRLLRGLGPQHRGLLLALRRQHRRLLLALGGEDRRALAAVGPHRLLHRVADRRRRLDAADLHAVDLDAPLAGRLVEDRRQLAVDVVAPGQRLLEREPADDVAQRRDDELLDRGDVVLDLVRRRGDVGRGVVDDGVDADDEVVAGDDRLRREADDLLADVDLDADLVQHRHEQVDARVERAAVAAEPLDDEHAGLRHDPHRRDEQEDRQGHEDQRRRRSRSCELLVQGRLLRAPGRRAGWRPRRRRRRRCGRRARRPRRRTGGPATARRPAAPGPLLAVTSWTTSTVPAGQPRRRPVAGPAPRGGGGRPGAPGRAAARRAGERRRAAPRSASVASAAPAAASAAAAEHQQDEVQRQQLGRAQRQAEHQPHGRGHASSCHPGLGRAVVGRRLPDPGRASIGRMTAYAAQLRVYEPLAGLPRGPSGPRWERVRRAGARPARARGRRWSTRRRAARARSACRPRVLPDLREHAFVTEVDGVTLVCPWRTRLRAWEALRIPGGAARRDRRRLRPPRGRRGGRRRARALARRAPRAARARADQHLAGAAALVPAGRPPGAGGQPRRARRRRRRPAATAPCARWSTARRCRGPAAASPGRWRCCAARSTTARRPPASRTSPAGSRSSTRARSSSSTTAAWCTCSTTTALAEDESARDVAARAGRARRGRGRGGGGGVRPGVRPDEGAAGGRERELITRGWFEDDPPGPYRTKRASRTLWLRADDPRDPLREDRP